MSKKKRSEPNEPLRQFHYPDGFNELLNQSKLLDDIVIQYESHGYDRSIIPPTLGDIADAVGHKGILNYSLHSAVVSWLLQNDNSTSDPWIEFRKDGVDSQKATMSTIRDHAADRTKRWIESIECDWYRVRSSKRHRYLKD